MGHLGTRGAKRGRNRPGTLRMVISWPQEYQGRPLREEGSRSLRPETWHDHNVVGSHFEVSPPGHVRCSTGAPGRRCVCSTHLELPVGSRTFHRLGVLRLHTCAENVPENFPQILVARGFLVCGRVPTGAMGLGGTGMEGAGDTGG